MQYTKTYYARIFFLRYVYHSSQWMAAGTTDSHPAPRTYIHPDSPSRGELWMRQPITFDKLKLTNHDANKKGHVRLWCHALRVAYRSSLLSLCKLNCNILHSTIDLATLFCVLTHVNSTVFCNLALLFFLYTTVKMYMMELLDWKTQTLGTSQLLANSSILEVWMLCLLVFFFCAVFPVD